MKSLEDSLLENCTCEYGNWMLVYVNASLQDGPSNVSSEIWCQDYNECCWNHVDMLRYWLGGVATVILCIIGITLNIGACCIWGSTKMRHPFNLLLIALSLFDCGYLLGAILESFALYFKLVSKMLLPLKDNKKNITIFHPSE